MPQGRTRSTKVTRGQGPKLQVSITVSPELLDWVRARVGPGRPFGSVSHAFESGIVNMMDPNERPR